MKLSDPVKKALKEAGRIILLSVVAGLITWLSGYIVGGELPDNWMAVASILLVVLKAFDKWLHEIGEETKNEALVTGLTRF